MLYESHTGYTANDLPRVYCSATAHHIPLTQRHTANRRTDAERAEPLGDEIGTPYDDVFRTSLHDCTHLAIPLLNRLFHESLPRDAPIYLRQNEHFSPTAEGELKKLVSDSNILVGPPGSETSYHLECQSTSAGGMLFRMLRYDMSIAMEDAIRSNGGPAMHCPRAGVLYLRKAPAGQQDVMLAGQAPREPDWHYRMEVLSVADYSLDELFDEELLILLPFHLFAYEHRFALYNEDDKAYAQLIATYVDLKRRLEELVLRGEIDEFTRRSIVDMTIKVAENLARRYNRVVEGVKKVMGGQVLEYEAKTIRNEALAEGRAEGEARGEAKGRAEGEAIGEARGVIKGKEQGTVLALSKAVSFGLLTIKQAAWVVDMTVEEFERKVAELAQA